MQRTQPLCDKKISNFFINRNETMLNRGTGRKRNNGRKTDFEIEMLEILTASKFDE